MTNAFDRLLLGNAPEFRATTRAAGLVAATRVTVLLQGESGTGKDLLARAIHQESPRHNGPFVAINCAALPVTLAEAELFGHAKGSFTGAVSDSRGRIQAATGGTLFLDEVGELPLGVQAKLLRFLETGECQAVGEPLPRQADVRLVAASHRELRELVKAGTFREDLFYRLNVVPLELPPLRQRAGDLELLLNHFLNELATTHGRSAPTLAPDARRLLHSHPWPGNVRELRNLCERLVVLWGGQRVEAADLPAEFHRHSRESAPAALATFVLPAGGIRFNDLEHHLILQALDHSGGNQTRAARLLGLTRDTLLYRMKKHAIPG